MDGSWAQNPLTVGWFSWFSLLPPCREEYPKSLMRNECSNDPRRPANSCSADTPKGRADDTNTKSHGTENNMPPQYFRKGHPPPPTIFSEGLTEPSSTHGTLQREWAGDCETSQARPRAREGEETTSPRLSVATDTPSVAISTFNITSLVCFFRFFRDPDHQMRRRVPPRPRLRDSKGGEPPQVFPVDMNLVKGILREFDRGAYGEEFRGDRLAKIAVLGKGGSFSCCCWWVGFWGSHLLFLTAMEKWAHHGFRA